MALAAERNIQDRLRSASRLEPDRLPRLKALGTEWAQAVQASLAAELGGTPAVEFTGVASLVHEPRKRRPELMSMLAVVGSATWHGPALALIDDAFADVVIEGLFGGDGGTASATRRRPTALDERFVRVALDKVLAAGNDVFAPIMPAVMSVERLVAANPEEVLDALTAGEARSFVEMSFRFSLGRTASTLRLALPETAIAPHRRKLHLVPDTASPVSDEGWSRDIQEGLQHADMQLRALLDEKATTLGAIARFAVGQTIVLDARVDSLITVECEEQRLFRGRMGRDRNSYLVRIEERIDPTQEFIDDILSD